MKRDDYVERALRSGYKIKDLDYLTTYEISKLPTQAYQPLRYRVSSNSANKLSPSEEVALKKYLKGK